MSPRSIYFDEQLTWECSELLANESFPQGSPGPTLIGGFERNRPLRLASLLHGASDPATEYTSGIVINYTYRTWLYLVETYRHCRLTYTSDTLPALAGLAKEFQVELEDDYLVGLWRKDVMRGLLWNRCVEHCRRIAYSPLATYRGKSYSLAVLVLLVRGTAADNDIISAFVVMGVHRSVGHVCPYLGHLPLENRTICCGSTRCHSHRGFEHNRSHHSWLPCNLWHVGPQQEFSNRFNCTL